jgi:hypothetical protein
MHTCLNILTISFTGIVTTTVTKSQNLVRIWFNCDRQTVLNPFCNFKLGTNERAQALLHTLKNTSTVTIQCTDGMSKRFISQSKGLVPRNWRPASFRLIMSSISLFECRNANHILTALVHRPGREQGKHIYVTFRSQHCRRLRST